jgi:hypothetical protein
MRWHISNKNEKAPDAEPSHSRTAQGQNRRPKPPGIKGFLLKESPTDRKEANNRELIRQKNRCYLLAKRKINVNGESELDLPQ